MQKRASLFWGSALILFAAVLFLKQTGILAGDVFGYFWPLLIIAAGIWLIVGFFTRHQSSEGEQISIQTDGAASALIKLDHGAGTLSMSSGALPGELLNGSFVNGLKHISRLEGGRLEVKLKTSQEFWTWWPGKSMDWDIHLTREIPLSLKIASGASASILDLNDLIVSDLDIDTGASSTELTLPAKAGNTQVDIHTGASSLNIIIPTGVAANIRIKSGISSIHVNSRFPRLDNGRYQSPDYGTAANRVDLTIDPGVGSIEIN
jgi:hypothetical protein